MVTSETKIPPAALTAELRDLKEADWPAIWEGPPQGGSPEFQRWCERRGWRPRTVEGDLRVLTRHGNTLYLRARGFWHPVVEVDLYLWRATTAEPGEKNETVARGAASWEEYARSIAEVFGTPTWSGAAGAADFPRPPHKHLWRIPSSERDNPYRLAYWASPAPERQHPILLLDQGVSLNTWEEQWGAGTTIAVEFHPPFPRSGDG